jgi:Kelch motif
VAGLGRGLTLPRQNCLSRKQAVFVLWVMHHMGPMRLVLRDGRVLVTGGQVAPGQATAAAMTFDPRTETWTRVGDLLTPRLKHFSVLLSDGRVLVMGGSSDDQNRLNSTEIFDPVANTFTPGPDMLEPRYKLSGGAVVLADGRVAIAGGGRTTEILDIAEGTSLVVTESTQRGSFSTINLLGSGDLLIFGGYDDTIRLRNEMIIVPAPTT